jgi:uncharacterized protein YqjF (DUF2071 family)
MSMSTAILTQPKTGTFLAAGWHQLAILNFPIDARVLEPYVPAGTELDLWQGQAYVSVVGFQFVDMKVLGIPVPFHRDFEEVNLRFYVRRQAPDGWRRGVVFLREIAPRWLVCAAARWFYNEKYVTMSMRQQVALPSATSDGVAQYEWWHAGRWHRMGVRFTGAPQPLQPGSVEDFITEHYWGYTTQRDGSTVEYAVEHPTWRFWPAQSAHYDCDVAAIYGEAFVPYLREPVSALVAEGSPILVRRGQRL